MSFKISSRGNNIDLEQQKFALTVATNAANQERSNLVSMAKYIKIAFDTHYEPSWHVIVSNGGSYSQAIRYAIKGLVMIEQKAESVAIGSKPLLILVFKSSPHKFENAFINNFSSDDNVKIKSKLLKISKERDSKYSNNLLALIDQIDETVKGDEVQLPIQLREKLNIYFGPQWHVVCGQTGETFHVEYTALRDDYIEAKVGKTNLRLIAWRHSQKQINTFYEIFTNIPILLFLLSALLFAVWYSIRNCSYKPCNFDVNDEFSMEIECTEASRQFEFDSCNERANYVLMAALSSMMVSAAVRYTSSLTKKSMKSKWLSQTKNVKFD